ncbi:MAG: phosphotransferase [Clostridia bacterium]|nr:phosphotransferase [Clostridia bacterium]
MKLDRVISVSNDKIIYRDSTKCIKTFISGYSKADVLNEALNLSRIEETGLNTPKLLEVTTMDGKWVIVTEYIRGKSLARLMKENPDRKDEYLRIFTELHISVHKTPCPELAPIKDSMNRKIIYCDLDANTRYELFARLEEMPRHNKLCHGNFTPDNILISDSGEAYILDWSHATRGNASADAAMTYLLFWMRGDISGAKSYLDLFCSETGTDREYVMSWMPLVAAAQYAKCSDKEREFLLSWTKNN